MSSDFTPRRRSRIASEATIFLLALAASTGVFVCSLAIQWLFYDDWLHRTGPLRVVGTALAAVITFISVLRWQQAAREREQEMMRRLQMIAEMNDRIRNALQAIEFVTYTTKPEATEPVRHAVDVIDRVLRDVLADAGPLRKQPKAEGRQAAAAGHGRTAKWR